MYNETRTERKYSTKDDLKYIPGYRSSLPITEFKPGQILTRLERSENGDGSYRGEPLKFMGIENNMIYCDAIKHFLATPDKPVIVDLELEDGWVNGWGVYVDPATLKVPTTVPEKIVKGFKKFWATVKQSKFVQEVKELWNDTMKVSL